MMIKNPAANLVMQIRICTNNGTVGFQKKFIKFYPYCRNAGKLLKGFPAFHL